MDRQHVEPRECEFLGDLTRGKGFDIHCDQIESGHFEGVIDFAGTAEAQIYRDRFSRAICIHGTIPAGMVTFACPATQAESGTFCGEPMSSGTLCVITPGDAYSYRAPANHGILGGCLAVGRIDHVLRTVHHTSLARVLRRTGNRQIPLTAMARIRYAMQSAFAAPPRSGVVLEERAFDRAVENRLLAALCAALTAETPPPPTRLAARNHWRCVRRARDFIEANLGVPLMLESLCGETGVSARTVENAFHAVMGLSPGQFIKSRRLNAARHALTGAHSRQTSVKSIALSCGFWHLGRFAHDYKGYFGESPSATLSR
jgi:AraC family transcriptional regulator, ethanolamine operon transcriptional activator